jgi:hypothetical protein
MLDGMRYPDETCIVCNAVTDTVVLVCGDRYWPAETLERLGVADGPAAVSEAHSLTPGLGPDGTSTAVITVCTRCAIKAPFQQVVLPNAHIGSAPILKQPERANG